MTPEILFTIEGTYLTVTDEKVFTSAFDGGQVLVRAFDIITGEELWEWQAEVETRAYILGADLERVYLAREDGRFYALDARSGQQLWKVAIYPDIVSDGYVHLVDQDRDRLYLALARSAGPAVYEDHVLLAVDKRDGSLVWERPGQAFLARTEQTLILQGIDECGIEGLDVVTLQVRWAVPDECWWPSKYQAVIESTIFLSPEKGTWETGPLVAFDIDSGRKLWQIDEEDLQQIVDISSTSIYVTPEHCWPSQLCLRVFDRETGEQLWTWQHPGEFVGLVEETVILSDWSLGFTWAVDARTGNIRWENDDLVLGIYGEPMRWWSERPAALHLHQGTLIAPMNSASPLERVEPAFLFGVDFATGQRKWRREAEATAPLLFRGRLIYGDGNNLLFVDPETGEQVAVLPLPCQLMPVIGSGGFRLSGDRLLMYDMSCLLAIRLP